MARSSAGFHESEERLRPETMDYHRAIVSLMEELAPISDEAWTELGGPVVWAPAIDGAVVVSTRGDDFLLTCGEDMAFGYLSHGPDRVELFVEESIAFRVLTPEAAVALRHRWSGRRVLK